MILASNFPSSWTSRYGFLNAASISDRSHDSVKASFVLFVLLCDGP